MMSDQNSLTRKEKINRIKDLIPDENLRHLLFNYEDDDDDFLSDTNKYLLYLSNIMLFTMLTVWNIYLVWKRNSNNREKLPSSNNSFWRIYNMLDKSCDPTKISGEFVDDLMINLEIDCLIDTYDNTSFVEVLGITNFFAFKNQGANKLSRYIYSVKRRRMSTKFIDKSFDFNALCDCIRICAFLRDIRISLSPIGILDNGTQRNDCLKVTADISRCGCNCSDNIDYLYSICIFDGVAAYYMEDFQTFDERRFNPQGKKPQYVKINYVQLGDRDKFSVIVSNEQIEELNEQYTIVESAAVEHFFLNFDIVNLCNVKSNGVFFRDYILLNNNYLKEFAYTIVDAISVKTCREIINNYSNKYQGIFDKMYVMSLYNDKEVVGYRWDEIILFLLLEEGVYEFLRFILLHESYKTIRASFGRRFGEERNKRIAKKEEFIRCPEAGLPVSASEGAKNDCRAKALVMLATKLLTDNDWELDKSVLPMTIDNIISECKRVYELRSVSNSEKAIYLSNMLLYVLRFVVRFYKGVFRYSHSRMNALLDVNSDSLFIVDYKKYRHAKEEWIKEIRTSLSEGGANDFSESTIRIADNQNIISKRIENAFRKLLQFNDDYSRYHDENNEILFNTLGKKQLFDSNVMKSICNDVLSSCKKSDKYFIEDFYSSVMHAFRYLKTGVEDNEIKDLGDNPIEYAIFPVVGQYCSGVTSVDGYKYSIFKMPSLDHFGQNTVVKVKIITEDEFDFGYSYFCVPNINRVANINGRNSFEKVWVSPIVIPCSVYMPLSISNMDILEKESDYDMAIELIYYSDEKNYEALFGSLENAKRILPTLLSDPTSKFYKEHYRIFKRNNEVVAIASLYDYSDCSWNTDLILKAFADENIDPPESFNEAIEYMKTVFNDFIGSSFYLVDDVCVSDEFRNQGIGSSMVLYLINKAESEGKSVRLSVGYDNFVAYHMYSSLGFVPILDENTSKRDSNSYIRMVKL